LTTHSYPSATRRIALVTNISSHYRLPLFRQLARSLDADFFFTGAGERRYWSSDHTISTEGIRAHTARNPVALFTGLARTRYDCLVIGLVGRLSLVAAVMAAKITRRPYVLWVGIWWRPRTLFHRIAWPAVRFLFRDADAVLVYGRHVGAFVAEEVGRRHRVFEAFQAVENEQFALAAKDSRLKARKELRVLFVGRLEPEKGLDILLESLTLCRPQVELELVGSGSTEPELRRQVARAGLEDRVRFRGYVPQSKLASRYAEADVLVLPSVTTRRFRETWGLVANEAMSAGTPVVASTAVGAAAGGLVVEGKTGMIVPERDRHSLAMALDRLATDRELVEEMGRNARAHVAHWSHRAAAVEFSAAIEAAIEARARR
jgi:glycosyltransferase involved in cell wall biosynthesis